ncbi:2-keto-4-pentenoate hydratase [Marinobacterium sedimentorum]|uniref:2-keto-4-pentenoate hydratase n=1 Tax=Marinobacterium sedimentorum TaxID=2927804 RepID=UPI0020C61F40|nr:fumarylacetoacetate hydrolase family protein [Marinobacterium sedimentorum]MCP8689778.1 fumarylacetoacetate hydrolase family protein [Marinobacterium sedimentorum]
MSLTAQQIEQAAAPLLSARLEHTQLSELPSGCTPDSYQDAYAIQDAVCHALWLNRGLRINAWKAGAANASVTPFVAPIPPDRVFDNHSTLAAADFHEIGAEAELAYRLGRDLPARDAPYSEAEVRSAIDGIQVTIEIIDSRMRHWREQTAFWQLADSQMNGALIVGDLYADWQNIDHSQQQALLLVDGSEHVSATASNTVGDPFNIMTAAINATVQRFGGLRAGDLFSAGSWTGTCFVEPGCEIIARFPGIGDARVSIS